MHVHGATRRGRGTLHTPLAVCALYLSISLPSFPSVSPPRSLSFSLSLSAPARERSGPTESVSLGPLLRLSLSLSLLWSLLSGFLYFPLSLSFPSLSFSRFISLYCFTTLSPILVFVLLNYVSYFYTVLLTIRISCQNTINFFFSFLLLPFFSRI